VVAPIPPTGTRGWEYNETNVPDSYDRDASDAHAGLPDHPDVMALVARAVNRDQAAFGALYERFVPHVYQYLYYRTSERRVAEDLTEQVFFRAWQAIESFRWQGQPFVAWLYSFAHLAGSVRDEAPDVGTADAAEVAAFGQTTDQGVLRERISGLSPEQQQVILLRFGRGLDTAEIAAQMGCDAAAVRVLQMQALRRLRQMLAQDLDRTWDV
jgi:RNA polymerase sigma-70 factor (ECF subfamily)